MKTMFKYSVGTRYLTQEGKWVWVLGRTTLLGYECLRCSDGAYRYDRSTHSSDAGRVTATAHDYSCPQNFKRFPPLEILRTGTVADKCKGSPVT